MQDLNIGLFLGALFPPFLISRLMLWLMKNWDGAALRLIVAHFVSLVVISIVAGYGMANDGPFDGIRAALTYGPLQLVWLIFDFVLMLRGKSVLLDPGGAKRDG